MIISLSKSPEIIANEFIENGGRQELLRIEDGIADNFSDEFQLYDRSVWTVQDREKMIKFFVNPIASDPFVLSAMFKELRQAHVALVNKVRSPCLFVSYIGLLSQR